MSAADKLTKLMEGATPGRVYLTNTWLSVGDGMNPIANFGGVKKADKDLIAYLRNNAEAIRDLIVAAEEAKKVLETDTSAIVDTVWVTGNRPETLLDMLSAALAKIKEQP